MRNYCLNPSESCYTYTNMSKSSRLKELVCSSKSDYPIKIIRVLERLTLQKPNLLRMALGLLRIMPGHEPCKMIFSYTTLNQLCPKLVWLILPAFIKLLSAFFLTDFRMPKIALMSSEMTYFHTMKLPSFGYIKPSDDHSIPAER